MITADFNEMSIEDLETIHSYKRISYLINDGLIVGTEKIPATDRKSEQG